MQLTNGTIGEEAEQNEPRAILEEEPADDRHHTQERRQHNNVVSPIRDTPIRVRVRRYGDTAIFKK